MQQFNLLFIWERHVYIKFICIELGFVENSTFYANLKINKIFSGESFIALPTPPVFLKFGQDIWRYEGRDIWQHLDLSFQKRIGDN